MSALIAGLIGNGMVAIPLALLAAAARRWGGSPGLVHTLWLLVLIKLVTPPLFSVGIPWGPPPERASAMRPHGDRSFQDTPSDEAAAPPAPLGLLGTIDLAGTSGGTSSIDLHAPLSPRHDLASALSAKPERVPVSLLEPPTTGERPEQSDLSSWEGPEGAVDSEIAASEVLALESAVAQGPARVVGSEGTDPLEAQRSRVSSAADSPVAISLGSWAAGLWLLGAVIVACISWLRILRFRRVLRLAHPAPVPLASEVRELAQQVGLRRAPHTCLIAAPVSPLVWGVGRLLRLVLPSALLERLGPGERTSLITHELVHLRRRDHWVRLLELAVGILYWWHPVVWWARRAMRQVEEESCDAQVLALLPEQGHSYARALVHTIEYLSTEHRALPLAASGLGSIRNLSRRLTMILEPSRSARPSRSGRFLALAIGLIALPFVPSLTAGRPDDEPPIGIEARLAVLDQELAGLAPELTALKESTAPQDGELEARRRRIERELAELEERRRAIDEERLHHEMALLEERQGRLNERLERVRHEARQVEDEMHDVLVRLESEVRQVESSEQDEEERRRAIERLNAQQERERDRHQSTMADLRAAEQEAEARMGELEERRVALESELRERQAAHQQDRLAREMEMLEVEAERLRNRNARNEPEATPARQHLHDEAPVRQRLLEEEHRRLQREHQARLEHSKRQMEIEALAASDRAALEQKALQHELDAERRALQSEVEELKRRLGVAQTHGRREEAAQIEYELSVAAMELEHRLEEAERRMQRQLERVEEEVALAQRDAERRFELESRQQELELQQQLRRIEAETAAFRKRSGAERQPLRSDRRSRAQDRRMGVDREAERHADQAGHELEELARRLSELRATGREAEADEIAMRLADLARQMAEQASQNRMNQPRPSEDPNARIDALEKKVDAILEELARLREQLGDRKMD